MDIVIIEDEWLAAERIQTLIKQYDDSINISACLESIEESVQWLNARPHPDLLLVDIHLSDGLSFEIFKTVNLQKPVIFTTAYDSYALDAFQHFSVDYILKPVTQEALATAINKYKSMAACLVANNYALLGDAVKENSLGSRYKNRFLARVGQRSFFLQAEEVAYFFADNKVVYLVDKEGNRFIINYTLEKLEPLLNPHDFFRVNRKMIIHSKAIEQVKPYFNNRLKLLLRDIKTDEEIIISRDRVTNFKTWAEA
ncbi:MAG TPA: LytTR family DNA-binding domain-containing protein [Ferruginibacter sp.]|nr:LytTR family DNA-binding domain-containing protein [Ferruginibacter sp.]HMP19978.1 LytTR family DNA-binding domain-containing protein [Ferruginibacter sp.]